MLGRAGAAGGGVAEAFPPEWMHARMKWFVLHRLRMLPVSARRKKGALYEWCVVVGVRLSAWMVEYVTGLPAGEV